MSNIFIRFLVFKGLYGEGVKTCTYQKVTNIWFDTTNGYFDIMLLIAMNLMNVPDYMLFPIVHLKIPQ